MRSKKTNLIAAVTCVMMFVAAPLLPLSAAYAKDGGGNGGGHGGGQGGGQGHSGGGQSGSHSGGISASGHTSGLKSDPDGKAVRDHGEKGKHYGQARNDSKGHGSTTSAVAHSKATRGLAKATSISATTPGDHNTKGLSKADTSTTRHDK